MPEALPEIARFSYVNESLKPVLHEVDPRLMRHVTQFFIRIWLFASGNDLHRTERTLHARFRPITPARNLSQDLSLLLHEINVVREFLPHGQPGNVLDRFTGLA